MSALALAPIVALLAPSAQESALDAVVKAQAAQASSRAYEITMCCLAGNPPARVVVVPPERFHLFDSVRGTPTETIQIGDRSWDKLGAEAWETRDTEISPSLHGPARSDDWALELREAKALGRRDLGGTRTQGYEYVVASETETTRVRMWVAEATGLPVRYESTLPGESVAWQVEYDPGLTVEPPPGQTAPPASAMRPANYPRLTLTLVAFPPRLEGDARRLPVVVVRGEGETLVAARVVPGQAALRDALRPLLREGGARAEFVLYAGHDTKWSAVGQVLDSAREAGATRVGLAARSSFGSEGVVWVAIGGPNAPPTDSKLPPLIVRTVSGGGRRQVVSLNRNEHSLEEFKAGVSDVLAHRRDKSAYVTADGGESLQSVVLAVWTLTQAGGTAVLTSPSMERLLPPLPPPPPTPPPS